MKILSPSQLQQADKETINSEGITSWELMERASLKAVDQLLKITHKTEQISVLAGSGNNGGDGLAIAYHLIKHDYVVDVHLLQYTDELSADCQKNLERLKSEKICDVITYNNQTAKLDFNTNDVIIDAVFGIGLNRDLPKFVEHIINNVNQRHAKRIAIDVPSGLFLNELTPKNAVVFQADYTLTFQCPKLNFFLPNYGNCIGKIQTVDIGLNKNFISNLNSPYRYVDKKMASSLLKSRQRFSHKGDYGHLLVVGGQYGMMGSVCLASKAALKSGVGKVSVLSPKCGVEIIQNFISEAMVVAANDLKNITPINLNFRPTHYCIGMGIGKSEKALDTLKFIVRQSNSPILIDADALNLISKHKELLDDLPSKSILTPHQGELKRLIGVWKDDYDKLLKMKSFAQKYDIVLVSKDAYTFVVYQDKIYVNSTGNAGMATAGSGDTLSGIIASLLAQGYSSVDACILGVYLHGKAADKYVEVFDQQSLIASDIIDHLNKAFKSLAF